MVARMKKKEQVDYIFFVYVSKGRKKITFQREEVAGIFVLKIQFYERKESIEKKRTKEELDLSDKIYKRIRRTIEKYQTQGCVLGADVYMANMLKMTELGFQARKQELLRQKEYIFERLRVERKEGRSSMLLVLDSKKWDSKEILSLLLTAKDYYEELYVVPEESNLTEINRIVEFLYEEWGIVLHIQSQKIVEKILNYDFVVFLLEKWNKRITGMYGFQNAYVVMDEEEEMTRNGVKTLKTNGGNLYSGLFYEKQCIPIPYQRAVDIFYQNPALYSQFDVSCVDICRLE